MALLLDPSVVLDRYVPMYVLLARSHLSLNLLVRTRNREAKSKLHSDQRTRVTRVAKPLAPGPDGAPTTYHDHEVS